MKVKETLSNALVQAIIERAQADEKIIRLRSALDAVTALEAEQKKAEEEANAPVE